jgi:hypothetical protein
MCPMKRPATRIEHVTGNLWSSFAVSLVIAALCFISFPAAPKVSALLTLVWTVLLVIAFTKFKWRAFWFLLGTPLVGYWLLVMYLLYSGCAHNIKNCP